VTNARRVAAVRSGCVRRELNTIDEIPTFVQTACNLRTGCLEVRQHIRRTMPVVDLPLGPIDYRVFGPDSPDAPTAVFVHGFLVNGTLWDPVAEQLAAAGVRSIVPDWPLGAHRTPTPDDVELSPTAVGQAVLDLLDALDLDEVTLVGNDTGGAICQLALKGDHHRIGALVLTNCDAFENFPPALFVPLFKLARHRAAVWTILQTTRLGLLRHSPLAFGQLLRRPRSQTLTRGWVQPALGDRRIRVDIVARSVRPSNPTGVGHSRPLVHRRHRPATRQHVPASSARRGRGRDHVRLDRPTRRGRPRDRRDHRQASPLQR
jgi:pimeloyl-ACP methyl ester carboxylesterase